MRQSTSEKRPWLAAVLAALATGLGHLYLRRWRRGLGWLLALFAANVLFVDSAALERFVNGNTPDPVALAPVFVVGFLSVVDAYLLARVQNSVVRPNVAPGESRARCPNCGKETDADLDFCHWCATDIGGSEAVGTTRDEK